MHRARWLLLCSLLGCVTAATRDDASTAARPAPAATKRDASAESAIASAMDAGADAGALAAGRPREVTAFYPVVEGVCPAARTVAIGTTPTLVFPRRAWQMRPTKARQVFEMPAARYDTFVGAMTGGDERIVEIGGVDDAHVWVVAGNHSGRGDNASYLILNGKILKTPEGAQSWFAIEHVLPQPDGSLWAYGLHSAYYGIPGDPPPPGPDESWQKLNRYLAWSADGTPIKPNLPGPDMEDASQMESGELLAAGRASSGQAMLRRWSPTRKVSDLVVPAAVLPDEHLTLALGTKRAVLQAGRSANAFFNYDGRDKLVAAPINARLKTVRSWLLTKADQLMVTTPDGTLLIEAADGTITEEKLPEPARLASEPGAPWLMADSGAVLARKATGWTKLVLPPGPWAAESRPPARIEWVRTLGASSASPARALPRAST